MNRSYKHNFFPLKDNSKRFDPANCDTSQEEPLLINPYEEQHPEQHLTFIGPNIHPLTDKGVASITYYGLDRKELDEPRRGIYNDILAFVDLAILAKGKDMETEINDKLKGRIKEKLDAGQYTLMIKCNFEKYM